MGSGCLWENKFKIYFKSFHLIFFLLATSAAAAYIRKDPFLSTFFLYFSTFFGKRLWRRLWLFRLLLLPGFGTGKSEDWSSLSWLFFLLLLYVLCCRVFLSFFLFRSRSKPARGEKWIGGRTNFFFDNLYLLLSRTWLFCGERLRMTGVPWPGKLSCSGCVEMEQDLDEEFGVATQNNMQIIFVFFEI